MIGQIIGNYKIEEKLGEGGMGAVYKGVDTMLDREVAIKALRPELARQTAIVERFRSEAVTLAKLHHPNIATLYSLFRQGDELYMVLEFVRGETLERVLQRRGALSAEEVIPVFCQILDGINHAHEYGIVHRDIKPANMMLTERGSLKVLDFGIARLLGSARMTRAGNIIGTLEYMAPEQVMGQETDARSDIYALGMMLYEMLTGRVPFVSENEFVLMRLQTEAMPVPPRQINASIPEEVEAAIMRAIEKDPHRRFQTAGEFRESLLDAGFAAQGRMRAVTTGNRQAQNDLHQTPSQSPSPVSPPVMRETWLDTPDTLKTLTAYANSDSPPATLLGSLTWMHYAGAGLAAILLLGLLAIVPFFILGGNGNSNVNVKNVNAPTPPTNINELAKAKIENALRRKGFNDVTVDTSTIPATLRGTVPKGEITGAVQIAQEAAGKPVSNTLQETYLENTNSTAKEVTNQNTNNGGISNTSSTVSNNDEQVLDIITNLIVKRGQMISKGDIDGLSQVLDDSYVEDNGDGTIWTKEHYLNNARGGDKDFKSMSVKDITLISNDGTNATVSCREIFNYKHGKGENYDSTYTAVNRNGNWLLSGWRKSD